MADEGEGGRGRDRFTFCFLAPTLFCTLAARTVAVFLSFLANPSSGLSALALSLSALHVRRRLLRLPTDL